MSVAQLEPASTEPDPYERPQPDHPDTVIVDGDTDNWKSYEIERLIDKRLRKYGRKTIIEYLVRWKGYGSEFDQWYGIDLLDNAAELVDDYERNHSMYPHTTANGPRRVRSTRRSMRMAAALE